MTSDASRIDDAEEFSCDVTDSHGNDVPSFAAYDGCRSLQGVVMKASHTGVLIKSGAQGSTPVAMKAALVL